jgi:hypothetical protein
VVGSHIPLVSRDCGVAGEAASLVSMECFSLGATLSIYYDSLIEKCSTLSVVCACTGLTRHFLT